MIMREICFGLLKETAKSKAELMVKTIDDKEQGLCQYTFESNIHTVSSQIIVRWMKCSDLACIFFDYAVYT